MKILWMNVYAFTAGGKKIVCAAKFENALDLARAYGAIHT